MRINELLEALASDADLKARYGDFDPEDKPMLPTTHVGGAPAPTLWTAYDVIRNILGKDRVTDDDEELGPGMYYVYQSSGPPMFRDTGDGVGSINLPNLDSKAAKDVAQAAHEAYHAYVHSKSQGGVVHANEKIINNLAEKWLRKHLSGPALHVGLEQIVGSRISYGPNHIPTQKENFADGRHPEDKGDSKRYHVPTKGKISTLRKIAHQGGRKGQLAHWMANMRSGKNK